MIEHLRIYAWSSVAVGFLQVVEGNELLQQGVPGGWSGVVGLIEIAWLFASVGAIVLCVRHRVTWVWPASFVAYNLFGWSYGMYRAFALHTLAVSRWSFALGVLFGTYFAVASALAGRSISKTISSREPA